MKNRCILELFSFLVSFFLICTLCAPLFSAQENLNDSMYSFSLMEEDTYTIKYFFEEPIITQVSIDSTQYSRIELSSAPCLGNPGEPLLPMYPVKLLIPVGKSVENIEVVPGDKNSLKLTQKIEPAGVVVPLHQIKNALVPTPDKTIYESAAIYPGKFFSDTGIQYFRGFPIQMMVLYPVQYHPRDDMLEYFSSFTIIVTLAEDAQEHYHYRGSMDDFDDVTRIVDNPEIVDTYQKRDIGLNSRTYDVMILTIPSLKEGFLPLVQAHREVGLKTRIITLNQIPRIGTSASISRIPEPDEIRDFIRNEYLSHGIRYVLLGGDSDVVPAQQLYFGQVYIWNWWLDIWGPSDFFYACLDGPYNFNGNDKWGEPTDGENGGDVDLLGDVYVGRACVGTLEEVNNFVHKTIAYMNRDPRDESLQEVILAGEYLWGPPDYPEEIYGDEYMEELVGGSDHNEYTTVGIPNDSYSLFAFTRFYERGGNYWSPSMLMNKINEGVHFINHIGHGSIDYALKMVIPDVLALSNEKHCFIYSQACLSGMFDDEYGDCIAEYFTVKTQYAAVAVIMNARYGLGDGYGTDGPSQRFHRWFWDGVFDHSITVISEANQYSKTVNIPLIQQDQNLRFICYGLNLFGDPTLSFNLPKPEHDIAISSVDLPDHIKSMDTRKVVVTLSNNGLNDEENLLVSLRVNGQQEADTILPFLAQGTQQDVVLSWTTPSAGQYLVTINVSVPGIVEHDYRNNEKTKNVCVGVMNRETDLLYDTIQAAVDDDATTTGNWILVPRGTYYENLVLRKGVFLKGENREGTILEATRSDIPVISVSDVCSASIFGLSIRKGRVGVSVESSTHTLIRDTTITNSLESGISVSSSQHTWINTNDIVDNHRGIMIDEYSSLNMICRNNFDNQENAVDVGFSNQWNGSDPGEGNFWSDFEINPGYPDTYIIPGGISQDLHPLPEPFTSNLSTPIVNWYTGERFFTIGAALSDAETKDGHIIFVGSGTYNEQLTISKRLTLIGENKDTTTIIFHSLNAHVIRITASQVILQGFTLTNSAEGIPGRFPKALVIESPWNLIQDNIIQGSGCQFSRGIEIASSAHNNTITGNTIGYSAYGMRLQSRDNRIYHNNFIDNNFNHVSANSQNPNLWDNGPITGGNYWQGHMCIGNPSDGSYPYEINANNIDYYPFQDPNGWM